jgi:prenyl protein peptidase
MVPALRSSGMTTTDLCWIAPLFFGFAHIHHAFVKLYKGHQLIPTVFSTIFQFAYTSVFGAYVAYVFLRTGSLVAVVLCHSMCNSMGLPNFSFFHRRSVLYPHRWLLIWMLAAGLFGFVYGLTRPFL